MTPEVAIDALASLPHCVLLESYGEAPLKARKAALNLHSGLVAALPDSAQSGWLGRKTLTPASGLYVICPNTKILGGDAAKDGTEWCQMLAGEEIGKLVATWTAQAVLLGLPLPR